MEIQPSRAPSSSSTTFSGISNYRTDSKSAPAAADYVLGSKTHYVELRRYLANYRPPAVPNDSHSKTRSKLTTISIQQFYELSTDVYDELVRRKDEKSGHSFSFPFLPAKGEYHPKRNQARQKLASLSTTRFDRLSSDVYLELSRRYPEFKEDPPGSRSNASNYDDDQLAPDFLSNSGSRTSGKISIGRSHWHSDSGYGGSVSSRRSFEDQDEDGIGPASKRQRDNVSDRYEGSFIDSSHPAPGNTRTGGSERNTPSEETAKVKREYEDKIAVMQSHIVLLQRDLIGSAELERKGTEHEARARRLEEQLADVRQELEDFKDLRLREARMTQEFAIFCDRYNRLEEENKDLHYQMKSNFELVEQLKTAKESLIKELDELTQWNERLVMTNDFDKILIRDLDDQLQEYKRQLQQEFGKVIPYGLETSSRPFLGMPELDRNDSRLPIASDGGIRDIHITLFLSAIHSLLVAGRLITTPTRVLAPMKAVIKAVTNVIVDVKVFECRPQQDRLNVNTDTLTYLCAKADATLNGLVAATQTHASSSGKSPVSLLDAAASQLSVTITEIGKTIYIRKTTKAEKEQALSTFSADNENVTPKIVGSPNHQALIRYPWPVTDIEVSEAASTSGSGSIYSRASSRTKSTDYGLFYRRTSTSLIFSHSPPPREDQRRVSQASSSLSGGFSDSLNSAANKDKGPPSENSSSEQPNSPLPITDDSQVDNGSEQAERVEDAWTELKPYLETQAQSIVYSIQSVLSAVRSPTPSSSLAESLEQIVVIVSSVIAVCNDNLPTANLLQRREILRDLGEHANKLSQVKLTIAGLAVGSRQIILKSVFAIANGMKGLTRL